MLSFQYFFQVESSVTDCCTASIVVRLDAGTFGTMGVGIGFAVAAAIWCRDYAPGKRVVCVEGDSAFGFSGMEIETLTR